MTTKRKNSSAKEQYESTFISRIEAYKDLPGYPYLGHFAQKCIETHCLDNMDGIAARVYMDMVIKDERYKGAKLDAWANLYIAKALWSELEDLPVNCNSEQLEQEWEIPNGLGECVCFEVGTDKEDIWHWFEKTFRVSVGNDLMGMEEEAS